MDLFGYNRKLSAEIINRSTTTLKMYIELAFENVDDFRKQSSKLIKEQEGGDPYFIINPRVPLNLYQLWIVEKISLFNSGISHGLHKGEIFQALVNSNPHAFDYDTFKLEQHDFWLRVQERRRGKRAPSSTYSVSNIQVLY